MYGVAIASQGMTIFPGKTSCFRRISPLLPDPGTTPTRKTAEIVGTVPAIIGSLQATEAMKILVGSEEVNRHPPARLHVNKRCLLRLVSRTIYRDCAYPDGDLSFFS